MSYLPQVLLVDHNLFGEVIDCDTMFGQLLDIELAQDLIVAYMALLVMEMQDLGVELLDDTELGVRFLSTTTTIIMLSRAWENQEGGVMEW